MSISAFSEQLLAELNITQPQVMSTSGTYHVVQGIQQQADRADVVVILKILQRVTPEKQAAFKKEATLLQWLSDQPGPLTMPHTVTYMENRDFPVLLYDVVPGVALGWYYFYVSSQRLLDDIGLPNLLAGFSYIAELGQLANTLGVPSLTTEQLQSQQATWLERADMRMFDGHSPANSEAIQRWLETPVLTHGDMNPKNIIVPLSASHQERAKVGIIDWSDAALGPRYYDLAFFWLSCWRQPDFQYQLALEAGEQPQFWQLIHYWLPKYVVMLEDSALALQAEHKAGHIPTEALHDNMAYIEQAKAHYLDAWPALRNLAR